MMGVARKLLALLRFGFTGWLREGPRGFVALAASLLFVFLALRGWLYPLNPDVVAHLGSPFSAELDPHVWGGPMLAGAWAAHAAIAVAVQAMCLGIIWRCREGSAA